MSRSKRAIWERLDLLYYRRRAPYRWWKRALYGAGALVAAAWVCVAAARDDRAPYSSGSMSVGHVMLADQCAKCHTDKFLRFKHIDENSRRLVMNRKCLECHGVSIGHDLATHAAWHQFTHPKDSARERQLACSACHHEHEGQVRLVDLQDGQCLQCHEDLTARANVTPRGVQARIRAFSDESKADAHPDFRPLFAKDKTPLRFNHFVHLQPLSDPDNPTKERVQLACGDCHRAGRSNLAWRFGMPLLHQDTGTAVTDNEPELQEAYMQPIQFSLHCAKCHEPRADMERLAGTDLVRPGAVPHETPRAIRTYVMGQLTRYIREQPEAERFEEFRARGISWRPPPQGKMADDEMNRLVLEWVTKETRVTEDYLYRRAKTCQKCHDQQWAEGDDELPRIVPPTIPKRWFEHASFTHERHRVVDCTECHRGVPESRETTDVLLPNIAACRACHGPRIDTPNGVRGGISDRCVFCHSFHRPPGAARPGRGRSIKDLSEFGQVLRPNE